MKKALKDFRTYLIALGLTVIGVGVPYLLFFLLEKQSIDYPVLHVVFASVYFLFSFIYPDIYILVYRKKTDNWNNELPQEKKDSVWMRRMPFYIACIIIMTVFLVSQVFRWITGSYPFM